MTKKYIKKPIEVEAVQWTGENCVEICDFVKGHEFWHKDGELSIDTLEGMMRADKGDYIIKEPYDKERAFYPCKLDIFKQTYEEVEE